MIFIKAFLVGGLICLMAQILMDKFKLLPVHLVVLFVVIGAGLEAFNLYDYLVEFSEAGAMLPISSFGHSLTDAAVNSALESNYLGLFSGVFTSTSVGISIAIFFAFIVALTTRPRG